MIKLTNLTKRYGAKPVVDHLTTTIRPGVVTGFLGPNGAGKSTTIHMLLGLLRPNFGSAFIDGLPYRRLRQPSAHIGAVLSTDAMNPKLTATQHLNLICSAAGLPPRRVSEVLQIVGIEYAANKAIETFSLGMKQRLGIASALINKPKTLIMDEPFNGLDVEGIRWLRAFAKSYAQEGNAVFISSHLMGEMQEIAERVIILSEGKLIADESMRTLRSRGDSAYICVRTAQPELMADTLVKAGATVEQVDDALHVRGVEMQEIGNLALKKHIAIYELTECKPTLEQAYYELVRTQKQGVNL